MKSGGLIQISYESLSFPEPEAARSAECSGCSSSRGVPGTDEMRNPGEFWVCLPAQTLQTAEPPCF